MIAADADVNTPPAEKFGGRTALQATARGGHLEGAERLIAAKADANAPPAENDSHMAL